MRHPHTEKHTRHRRHHSINSSYQPADAAADERLHRGDESLLFTDGDDDDRRRENEDAVLAATAAADKVYNADCHVVYIAHN